MNETVVVDEGRPNVCNAIHGTFNQGAHGPKPCMRVVKDAGKTSQAAW